MPDTAAPAEDLTKNPNVLALALELYQASYPRSKPSDHPDLWNVHVQHVIKSLSLPVGMTMASSVTPAQKQAALDDEAILFGGKVKETLQALLAQGVGASIAEDVASSVKSAASESTDAKAALLNEGIVKPGLAKTFEAP